MKKYLFAPTVLALMLSACSNDSTVDSPAPAGEIAFAPTFEGVSRSLPTPLPPSNLMVSAFKNVDGTLTPFLSDLHISGGRGSAWKPVDGGAYYFPKEHLSFYSYAPAEINGKSNFAEGDHSISNYIVETELNEQTDLLVAANDDPTLGTEGKTTVNLKHHHALSQVEFKIKSSNPAMRYEIAGIRICALKSIGNFTFPEPNGKDEIEISQSDWNVFSTVRKAYSYNLSRHITFDGDINVSSVYDVNSMDFFKVIPQDLTKAGEAWDNSNIVKGAYVSVKCKMWVKDSEKGTKTLFFPAVDNGKFGLAAVPLKVSFQPGKHYVITLDLAEGGRIDPSPALITDPEVNPTPMPGKKGGDLLSNGEISFHPDVVEWGTFPTVDIKEDI